MFLLLNDGRVVLHQSAETSGGTEPGAVHGPVPGRPADVDIVAGMLMAIQDFVATGLGSEAGSLKTIAYGGNIIILARRDPVILAAVLDGREPPGLQERMRELLDAVLKEAGADLAPWDGDRTAMEERLRPVVDLPRAFRGFTR